MTPRAPALVSSIEVVGLLITLAAGAAGALALLPVDLAAARRRWRRVAWLERERDLAANLDWPWPRWVGARVLLLGAGLGAGLLSRVWVLAVVGALVGLAGFRFAVAGRATSRRLRMERAFLAVLRDLRDRLVVGNQSLDTALAEIGRQPPPELVRTLRPLAGGGSVAEAIVEVARRARSPVVEHACAALIWSRTRSLDALIDTIDGILLPVGQAQLAIQEESAVTLAQQRAVSLAMSALLVAMLAVVLRVDTFRAYYQSLAGNLLLLVVVLLFAALVGLLSLIVRVQPWTRWDLTRLVQEEERLGGR